MVPPLNGMPWGMFQEYFKSPNMVRYASLARTCQRGRALPPSVEKAKVKETIKKVGNSRKNVEVSLEK
jgi:hypothetical protein